MSKATNEIIKAINDLERRIETGLEIVPTERPPSSAFFGFMTVVFNFNITPS
jgi:hypothetical protein